MSLTFDDLFLIREKLPFKDVLSFDRATGTIAKRHPRRIPREDMAFYEICLNFPKPNVVEEGWYQEVNVTLSKVQIHIATNESRWVGTIYDYGDIYWIQDMNDGSFPEFRQAM